MTKILPPGVTRKFRKKNGYILMDVLVAVFSAALGFTALFGGFSAAISYQLKTEDLFLEAVNQFSESFNQENTEISSSLQGLE